MRSTFFIIVSLGVVVAGVHFGKKDLEDRRGRRPDTSTPTPSGTETDTRASSDRPSNPPHDQRSLPTPGRVEDAIRRLEAQLAEEGLSRAADAAAKEIDELLFEFDFISRDEPGLLETIAPLRRWELAAKVFHAIVEPIEAEEIPASFFEVHLRTGDRMRARQVTRVNDSYEIAFLPVGQVVLRADRVDRVTKLSAEQYRERTRKEIAALAEQISTPIDLYVKAVTPCFRCGLEKEGYKLLRRLLSMPNSNRALAIFAGDTDGNVTRMWEQAAERMPLDALVGSGKAPGTSSSNTPLATEGSAAAVDETTVRRALDQVRGLLAGARATYQRIVVDTTGKLDELHDARLQLGEAGEILSGLSSSRRDVKNARRHVAELLHAVIKSLPFCGPAQE